MRYHKRYLLFIGFCVLLLLGFGVWSALNRRSFTTKIIIQVTPASSLITLGNNRIKAGTVGLRPDTYIIKASHDGFITDSKTVTVKSGSILYVGLALLSNSSSTATWYQDHPADQQLFEAITGKYFDIVTKSQLDTLPLVKYLPFIDLYYRVDYGQSKTHLNDPSAVALYITYYSMAGKQQALEWLKFKGYDPSLLDIIYTDKTSLSQ